MKKSILIPTIVCCGLVAAYALFIYLHEDDLWNHKGLAELIEKENHLPIEFYGQVLDSQNNPIPDAQIAATIYSNSEEHAATVTGADGKFQFTGFRGNSLWLVVAKPGYQFTPESEPHYLYSQRFGPEEQRYQPDPANPVKLKMWKLQGAEATLKGRVVIPILPNGTEYRIDLQTGKIVATGGELTVSMEYDLYAPPSVLEFPFDWKARVVVADGGLAEALGPYENMLLAPDAPYSTATEFGMPKTQQDWRASRTENFYVKTRGHQFAKLSIRAECTPKEKRATMFLEWLLNPSGSRNLEFEAKLSSELK